MKRYLMFSVGMMLLLGVIFSVPTKAQIYGEFDDVKIVKAAYEELVGYNEVLVTDLVIPPTWTQNRDDGYAQVPIGFEFMFNGTVYTKVWINVNGFVTFSQPPNVLPKEPKGLFIEHASYPMNVVAPFWGDHYYRTGKKADGEQDYLETKILYKTLGDRFIIEWRDLNVNDATNPASVANFQVILYKSTDPYSKQGNIEFAYGDIGNPKLPTVLPEISGASVGIKGESNDFLNGLYNGAVYEFDADLARKSDSLTKTWTPSKYNDNRICFVANIRYNDEYIWGDGDADMSKSEGGKHFKYKDEQRRFVTVNDARLIMRSVATHTPLDSVRFRNAYHGDVNRNGRYFYFNYSYKIRVKAWAPDGKINPDSLNPVTGLPVDTTVYLTKRYDMPWRTLDKIETQRYDDYMDSVLSIRHTEVYNFKYMYTDTTIRFNDVVNSGINSPKRIYFQTTEKDAAMIIHYLGCKIPFMPWVLDTIIYWGKISADEVIANNIKAGQVINLGNGSYKIPMYLNGSFDGAVSGKFDIGNEITDVAVQEYENNTMNVDYEANTLVFAGAGKYTDDMPLFYVTIKSNNPVINISNVRFDDINKEDITLNIKTEETENTNLLVQNKPNPFTESTDIIVNINNPGYYTLNIYDELGNKVKTIANMDMNVNTYHFNWNGENEAGVKVNSGLYIYRLVGDNVSVSQKLIYNK